MSDVNETSGPPEFNLEDGMALARAYLADPSDVPCPHCGPNTIEVVCFLDARSMEHGAAVPTSPDGDYTVILYCHNCGRAAALDLSREDGDNRRAA